MIYLDNAATSGTKPEEVYRAADSALRNASGNPGRSGHRRSLDAGRLVQEARILCAKLFGIRDASRIIFCSNATDALNLAIHGMVKPGSNAVTSGMEHNSVSRPLEKLRTEHNVEIRKISTSVDSGVDMEELGRSIDQNTSLVVLNHMSNVTGTVSDIAAAGRICREKGVPLLVDASQSAGVLPIDVTEMNIDLLAFPGHKSLMGPQGTGGLYIGPDIRPDTLKQGGTGSRSELPAMPDTLPDRYEAGTLNVPGIAGLAAGIQWILNEGTDKIAAKEVKLADMAAEELGKLPGVRVIGPSAGHARGPVVSFVCDDMEPQETALLLDQAFDIAVRAGLHCAPDAHRSFGTFDSGGTVRVSPGYFNTEDDIRQLVEAVAEITGDMQ